MHQASTNIWKRANTPISCLFPRIRLQNAAVESCFKLVLNKHRRKLQICFVLEIVRYSFNWGRKPKRNQTTDVFKVGPVGCPV